MRSTTRGDNITVRHKQMYKHRQVHEAYQYLVTKKKKMSGRTMAENWDLTRRKSVGVALLSLAAAKEVRSDRMEEIFLHSLNKG